MGVETITLRHWMENERVAEETVQWPSMVWEMEETGWESKMDPVGRVAARLFENDCVPFQGESAWLTRVFRRCFMRELEALAN